MDMSGINSLSGLNKVNVDFRPTVSLDEQRKVDANEPGHPLGVAPGNAQPAKVDSVVLKGMGLVRLECRTKGDGDSPERIHIAAASLPATGTGVLASGSSALRGRNKQICGDGPRESVA